MALASRFQVRTFLQSRSTTGRNSALTHELKSLEGERLKGVALGLALMWGDFFEQFGGLADFARNDEAKHAYMEKLRRIADHLETQHNSYSVALRAFLGYLAALSEQTPSTGNRELVSVIGGLIDLGGSIRRPAE